MGQHNLKAKPAENLISTTFIGCAISSARKMLRSMDAGTLEWDRMVRYCVRRGWRRIAPVVAISVSRGGGVWPPGVLQC